MEWASGNIFIRTNTLAKAGDVMEGHTHNFDHTTILFRGSFRIKAKLANGTEIEREAKAPAHFLIHAHVVHEITALEDDTLIWCVYAHRNAQGEVVEQYDGFFDSYV